MRRRENFFKYMLMAGLCLATFSCSDDDKIIDGPLPPPVLGGTNNSGTVTSEKNHQTLQLHRSSDNFSIEGKDHADNRNAYIHWTLDPEYRNVKFKVMIDKSGAADGEVFFGKHLGHGSITTNDREVWKNKDRLYIADPENATSKFKVHYELCIPEPRHVWVSCANAGGSKDKRSSHNIYFLAARNKIVCPEGATFYLRHDKGAQTDDNYTKKPLSNGDTIPAYADAFVSGASKDFILKLEPADDPNYTDWMGKQPDSSPLHQLSIPGTHDSGTGNDEIASGMFKCQNFDFPVQMSDGIRYFDVRLNSNLITHHGGNKSDTSADMLFGYAKDFLKQHPTETLFFLVTPDDPKKFMDFIEKEENEEYDKIIYREDKMPATLGAARGKIILLRRFAKFGDYKCGIDMHTDWPDDDAALFATTANDNFYVQDRYFSAVDEFFSGHDTQEKRDYLDKGMECVNGEMDIYDDAFFIQYSSIAGRITGQMPWDYAWGGSGVDKGMNVYLDELFKEYEEIEKGNKEIPGKKVRTGVIVMDFYNRHGEMYENDQKENHHDLVRRIINFNLPAGQKIQ